MRRKLLLVCVALIALSFGAWILLRGAYHEWRLRVAIDDYERLRENRYSLVEDVVGLVRGEPLTYSEYEDRAREHQEALVQLKQYERREILLTSPLTNTARQDELADMAMKRISPHATWAFTFTPGATSIVVTDQRERFAKWEKLVREFDAPKGTNQTAGEPKSKPAC